MESRQKIQINHGGQKHGHRDYHRNDTAFCKDSQHTYKAYNNRRHEIINLHPEEIYDILNICNQNFDD